MCIFLALLLLIAACQTVTAEKAVGQQFLPSSWTRSSFWSWMTGKSAQKPAEPKNIPTIDVELPVLVPAGESKTADHDKLVICTWNIFRFGPSKFSSPDLLHTAGHNVSRMDIMVDVSLRDFKKAYKN